MAKPSKRGDPVNRIFVETAVPPMRVELVLFKACTIVNVMTRIDYRDGPKGWLAGESYEIPDKVLTPSEALDYVMVMRRLKEARP